MTTEKPKTTRPPWTARRITINLDQAHADMLEEVATLLGPTRRGTRGNITMAIEYAIATAHAGLTVNTQHHG